MATDTSTPTVPGQVRGESTRPISPAVYDNNPTWDGFRPDALEIEPNSNYDIVFRKPPLIISQPTSLDAASRQPEQNVPIKPETAQSVLEPMGGTGSMSFDSTIKPVAETTGIIIDKASDMGVALATKLKTEGVGAIKDVFDLKQDILGPTEKKSEKPEDPEEVRRKNEATIQRATENWTVDLNGALQITDKQEKQKEDARLEVQGMSDEQLAHESGSQRGVRGIIKNLYTKVFINFKRIIDAAKKVAQETSPFGMVNARNRVSDQLRLDKVNEGGMLSATGGVGAG